MTPRHRHRAFIGLGGNQPGPLGGPADYIEAACQQLAASDRLDLKRKSRHYRSAPWGKTDQSDFINAVAEVSTSLEADELLKQLQQVEDALGRRRAEQWGPRVIDLDLLSFDDRVQEEEQLVLPHPRMHERAFVLVPLLELEPDFLVPGKGRADRLLAAIGEAQRVTPL